MCWCLSKIWFWGLNDTEISYSNSCKYFVSLFIFTPLISLVGTQSFRKLGFLIRCSHILPEGAAWSEGCPGMWLLPWSCRALPPAFPPPGSSHSKTTMRPWWTCPQHSQKCLEVHPSIPLSHLTRWPRGRREISVHPHARSACSRKPPCPGYFSRRSGHRKQLCVCPQSVADEKTSWWAAACGAARQPHLQCTGRIVHWAFCSPAEGKQPLAEGQ